MGSRVWINVKDFFGSAEDGARVSAPLTSTVTWALSSLLSVPGFVLSEIQLQEDGQGVAAALFLGSGNEAGGTRELLFDGHTRLLWPGYHNSLQAYG